MKLKNVVAGMLIEAKHKAYGLSQEIIPKGLQVLVTDIDGSPTYGVSITHADIADGYAWVNAEDFRKVKEVVEEAPTEHVYKVGDKVLVGAEGAGHGIVDPEPVRPEVGDWVVATAVDSNLVAGEAYKVVSFSSVSDPAGIALHTHRCSAWQKVYYINTEDYSIVLREVKPDADTHT